MDRIAAAPASAMVYGNCMASIAAAPQFRLIGPGGSAAPTYADFIGELRNRAEFERAKKPPGTIDVVVSYGATTVLMRLNKDLWCQQLALPSPKGDPKWLDLPGPMENYPTGEFRISAKEWAANLEKAAAWLAANGTKVSLENAPYLLVFFVSEAARFEAVRLQAVDLFRSNEATINWTVVRPLLVNWSAISGKVMGLEAKPCLDYAREQGQKDIPTNTREWLAKMAAL